MTTVPEVWFLTGSQALYGEDTLRQVADQSQYVAEQLATGLDEFDGQARVVWKPVLTDAAAIRRACLDASADDNCVGQIAWLSS